MSDKNEHSEGLEAGGYERPVLVAMGNLHDLLAGTGSQTADGTFPAISCAPNSDHTDPVNC